MKNNQSSKQKTEKMDMKKYNITSKFVEYFQYGDFRYTTLADAVNQAVRDEESGSRKR